MKEIVTIQVGGFANFVGSHFWNFQDEILGLSEGNYDDYWIPGGGLNLDVIFRAGETSLGRPTYTPRLVSIDCRGSAGSVSSSGTLYRRPPSTEVNLVLGLSRKGPVLTFKSEPNKKNKFLQSLDDEEENSDWSGISAEPAPSNPEASQGNVPENMQMADGIGKEQDLVQDLDDGVRYWTDYLKAHLHASTIYQVPGIWVGEPGFEHYGCGKELVSGEEVLEEVGDRLRHFAEECDHMQGFQCLVDDSTGFSSVAANVLSDLSNEYAKSPICLFTARPPDMIAPVNDAVIQSLHDVVSFAKLASLASVTVPLGLPQLSQSAFAEHLTLEDKKPFHSSALYAAAVNGITFPYKMEDYGPLDSSVRGNGVGSSDMGSSLDLVTCGSTRPVALLEVAFPAPPIPELPQRESSVSDALGAFACADASNGRGYDLQRVSALTSDTRPESLGDAVAEMVVVQGARFSDGRGPAPIPLVYDSLSRSNERWVRASMNTRRGRMLQHLAVTNCPLTIPVPFPRIFAPHIGRYGDVLSRPATAKSGTARGGLDVVSTPLLARLSTSGALLPYIERRRNDLHRLGMGRGTRGSLVLDAWGFAREEVQELYEDISAILDGYSSTNVSESSDDDGI